MSGFLRLKEEFAACRRRPIRILGASGQLGYGIPTPALEEGIRRRPDLIGCDMGSIDIGPYYLGSGRMAVSHEGAKRDLRKVLRAARGLDVPLVIGSAGSAGAAPHLAETEAIIREIAAEEGLRFSLAVISADIDRDQAVAAIRAGGMLPMETMQALGEEEVRGASHLVAQMGLEMIQKALARGADVVVTGRACDTGIFAAMPILLGFPEGLAIHLAKIVECASLCCVPGGRDAMLATLSDDGFELESMNPARAATPSSVAAHSLYEQSDPFSIHEPSGRVDLGEVVYRAIDERRTWVSGARFEAAKTQRIKLEGAKLAGERAILLCANADPRFIEDRQAIITGVEKLVESLVCEDRPKDYRLLFHLYGVDGVMPPSAAAGLPREIGILVECIAPTAERAMDVLRTTKQFMMHYGYPRRLSTAGNLAFPFTPPEIHVGPAYEFSVFHLMEVDDQSDVFDLRLAEVKGHHRRSLPKNAV